MRNIAFLIVFLISIGSANAQDISSISLLNVASEQQEPVSEVLASGINVIVFVDVTCPYIEAYQQRIAALDQQLKQQGYKLIFVNPHQLKLADENSLVAMKQQSQQYGWEGSYFSDQEQQLAHLLQASKIPEIYIVNHKGERLEVLYAGAIDDNPQQEQMVSNQYARNAIIDIKNGRAVQPKKVLALGCRIMKF